MQPPQSLYSSSGWWALRSRCPSANGRPLEFQVWQAASLMFGRGDSHIRTYPGPPVREPGNCMSECCPSAAENNIPAGEIAFVSNAAKRRFQRGINRTTHALGRQYSSSSSLLITYTGQTSAAHLAARVAGCLYRDRAKAQILVGTVQDLASIVNVPNTSPSVHPVERVVQPERSAR